MILVRGYANEVNETWAVSTDCGYPLERIEVTLSFSPIRFRPKLNLGSISYRTLMVGGKLYRINQIANAVDYITMSQIIDDSFFEIRFRTTGATNIENYPKVATIQWACIPSTVEGIIIIILIYYQLQSGLVFGIMQFGGFQLFKSN